MSNKIVAYDQFNKQLESFKDSFESNKRKINDVRESMGKYVEEETKDAYENMQKAIRDYRNKQYAARNSDKYKTFVDELDGLELKHRHQLRQITSMKRQAENYVYNSDKLSSKEKRTMINKINRVAQETLYPEASKWFKNLGDDDGNTSVFFDFDVNGFRSNLSNMFFQRGFGSTPMFW